MAVEQDTLARMASGPEFATKELLAPPPSFVALCPRLAKIEPSEASAFDAAWQKWFKESLYRLQGGANPS